MLPAAFHVEYDGELTHQECAIFYLVIQSNDVRVLSGALVKRLSLVILCSANVLSSNCIPPEKNTRKTIIITSSLQSWRNSPIIMYSLVTYFFSNHAMYNTGSANSWSKAPSG